jgi:hypothetical protein
MKVMLFPTISLIKVNFIISAVVHLFQHPLVS